MTQTYSLLKQYPQFILWELVPSEPKPLKVPCYPTGIRGADAHTPTNWMSFDQASATAQLLGSAYGIGFVLTDNDPFFVVDIDACLQADNMWSPLALSLMSMLPGALVEVSQSGTGLHIFGIGPVPPHAKKNQALHIEMYHNKRFMALGNMATATGYEGTDCTAMLPQLVATYFPPTSSDGFSDLADWTTDPVPEWDGTSDNVALIESALKSRSAAATFGGGITFEDLWTCNVDRLARVFPSSTGGSYDGSSVDASLAQHLAFWTGKNCERMEVLMRESALVREKWDREDYLPRTILRACSLQTDVYGQKTAPIHSVETVKLHGASPKQVAFAEEIRTAALNTVASYNPEGAAILAQETSASVFTNNPRATPEELIAMLTPNPLRVAVVSPTLKMGYQFLGPSQQIDHFKGCTYVRSAHRVFIPNGDMLKPDQFNVVYGGFVFQIDDSGKKTTKKAWEAFTESQVVAYPTADDLWFRPNMPSGALIPHEGKVYLNTYVPVITERRSGDVSPFLTHVAKLLPDERDRTILLSYMAACVQHIGVKFQWCPLIQGVEGNGKSLLTRCVSFAIGKRYTHFPPAQEIGEKFNGWLFTNLFIGVEDIFVPTHKQDLIEVLKPMITGERIGKRVMNQDQSMGDNYANFILNSNHRNAIPQSDNGRRWCIFYTAQQEASDLKRDGMDGSYMVLLYKWLDAGGYAIVNDYLRSYQIPPEFNPAVDCHRAPTTSSAEEVKVHSAGVVDQSVQEAINEGYVGMMGGWVSSIALSRLLEEKRYNLSVPENKRRDLMKRLGYDYHPGLGKDGRTNSITGIDGAGKKPRLYIKEGSGLELIEGAAAIAAAYVAAQTTAGVFG